MAASLTFYNSWRYALGRAVDLSTPPTVKWTLHTSSYSPNAGTHTVYADLTNELATANGYTSGGAALGSVTWTRSGGAVTFDAADTAWTASGGSLVARYAVIRKDGTTGGVVSPLVAYVLLDSTPADVTTTDGGTLTLQWNASGIFGLS